MLFNTAKVFMILCRGDLQKDFQAERNLARDRQQKIAELNAVS